MLLIFIHHKLLALVGALYPFMLQRMSKVIHILHAMLSSRYIDYTCFWGIMLIRTAQLGDNNSTPCTQDYPDNVHLMQMQWQATIGPCNTSEPNAWNTVEKSKWSMYAYI